MGPQQTKALQSKRNNQQNEKATYEMGENIFANHISDKALNSKYIKTRITQ